MTGPMLMFFDPEAKREFVINVAWITHIYENPLKDALPTCTLVLGIGSGLMLTVSGTLNGISALLTEAVS